MEGVGLASLMRLLAIQVIGVLAPSRAAEGVPASDIGANLVTAALVVLAVSLSTAAIAAIAGAAIHAAAIPSVAQSAVVASSVRVAVEYYYVLVLVCCWYVVRCRCVGGLVDFHSCWPFPHALAQLFS